MPKPDPINIDPKSPPYDSLDEAANALTALFPNPGAETAGMVYKSSDGKFRYSTTVPGSDDHFVLRALVPQGVSLAAIAHSHPKAADSQFFSADDVATANQMKLPSYVRFLTDNAVRVYRPGATKTENLPMAGSRFGQVGARGDSLVLPPAPPTITEQPSSPPLMTAKLEIAKQLGAQ